MNEQRNAVEIIKLLDLKPHPEGGWYKQMFEDPDTERGRARSTAIYYLLEAGDRSHWHRVDAVEIWHFYAGAPLELAISPDGETSETNILGVDLIKGQRPQIIVPEGQWQSAKSLGQSAKSLGQSAKSLEDWTLCGCTVAPGFRFDGFEMAAQKWVPGL